MGFLTSFIPILKETVASDYYDKVKPKAKKNSLVEAIKKSKNFPIIGEVKPFSPSNGRLIYRDPLEIADEMVKSGVIALSILTEPKHFGGNVKLLEKDFKVPIIMKDFVINKKQIIGGDAVLLILPLLDMLSIDVMLLIDEAHSKGIEVLLEVSTVEEFRRAKKTDADLIGINNRNLETLGLNLNTTPNILNNERPDRLIVSESGIESRDDLQKVKNAGANAALIGTSILKSTSIKEKIKELLIKK